MVLSDQGTADDLNSNALEITIANGKVCLVSWTEIKLFKQVGFPERFMFCTYKEEMKLYS